MRIVVCGHGPAALSNHLGTAAKRSHDFKRSLLISLLGLLVFLVLAVDGVHAQALSCHALGPADNGAICQSKMEALEASQDSLRLYLGGEATAGDIVEGPDYIGQWRLIYGQNDTFFYRYYRYPYEPGKVLGSEVCIANTQTPSNTHCGNPINAAIGNKYQREPDFEVTALLAFTRHYNSHPLANGSSLGAHWTHTFTRSIYYVASTGRVVIFRPDGGSIRFHLDSGQWLPDADVLATLSRHEDGQGQLTGWTYKKRGAEEVEEFDALGRLVQITRSDGTFASLVYNNGVVENNANDLRLTRVEAQDGRAIVFQYGSSGSLDKVFTPEGSEYLYAYDSTGRLSSVTKPGGSQRTYHYSEYAYTSGVALTYALTGITDESGQRFAVYKYASDGRAVSTEHAGGVDKFSVQYNSDGSALITQPLGAEQRRTFEIVLGVNKATSMVEQCVGCPTTTASYDFDSVGRLESMIDPRGNSTENSYGSNGFIAQRIEASNDTAGRKRTTQTDWHATLDMPIERRTYDAANGLVAKQNWIYNARGQVLSGTLTSPATAATRTISTTYCEQADVTAGTCPRVGLVKSIDGARTDVTDQTSFTYRASNHAGCASSPSACLYRKGDLWKVTNALGHVIETLSYDGAGRPTQVKDANGVITEMTYHPRGWLTSRTIKGATSGEDRITLIDYWSTGLVKRVTQADGSYTQYTYDAAHRLTDIADSAGNTIHYTLDNAGNRTAEATRDSSNVLTRSLSRVYNQLGQLQSQSDAYSHATGYTYDANGNMDVVTDALSRGTDNAYDPLDRLAQTIQDVGGIAAMTQFQYDANDNLTRVIDPKGLNTDYTYNAFGDLTELTSPDTGVTSYTYDNAGNRASQTDARAKVQSYTYDALSRLTKVTGPTRTFTYDNNNTSVCLTNERFAKGRLSGLSDPSGSTKYCYNRFGDLTSKVQTTNGVVFTTRYGYDTAGRLASQTYPDGAVLDAVRDTEGRITELGVTPSGGARQIVLTGATYAPFGPATSWAYGNGRTLLRSLNQNYQPLAIHDAGTGGLSLAFGFDAVGNLNLLQDGTQASNLAQYGYDALNRLTQTRDGPTGTPIETYGYDATGNRTSALQAGVTTSYTYPAGSHRLSQVGAVARTYDASGNTTKIGANARQFVYDNSGRMTQVKAGSTVTQQYAYNAKGEQVRAYLDTANAYFVYDEAGHLLGEYDAAGAPKQQMLWFGDLPVGVLQGGGANQKLHYIEPDHLGTPRVVIDGARNVPVWKWELTGEAFGNTPPNQDPDADSVTFIFNLRYPGQRYDGATGLNYNYFRDYDPSTGRYVQSDPIGLGGGMSTYAYASSFPVGSTDQYGLSDGGGCLTVALIPNPFGQGWELQACSYPAWTPRPGVTHPDHSEVAEALACPKSGGDCEQLALSIEIILLDLRFRRWDMQRYAARNSGSLDPNHVTRYQNERAVLADLVRAAKRRNCPYNPDADKEITLGPRYPTPNY